MKQQETIRKIYKKTTFEITQNTSHSKFYKKK
jgi:hypothetical protein